MAEQVVVIIGVSALQGLGAKLARRFAQGGAHVFIGGRTREKLDAVADSIRAEDVEITPVVADATDPASVQGLFDEAASAGPIRLSIYNAGNNMPCDLLGMESDFFERCWRVACFGGFLFSQQALRHMVPNGEGTLLFTGGSAAIHGNPLLSAFGAAKAGLRALAKSLAREFQPQGIHVGHVVIDGDSSGDHSERGRPQLAQTLTEERRIDLEGVVYIYEMLHRQPRRAWSHEIDVRSFEQAF